MSTAINVRDAHVRRLDSILKANPELDGRADLVDMALALALPVFEDVTDAGLVAMYLRRVERRLDAVGRDNGWEDDDAPPK